MYDEQLEELIDAALEDGVLTEKEKQVLFKKAQSMGIDLDEFEMVLLPAVWTARPSGRCLPSFSAWSILRRISH